MGFFTFEPVLPAATPADQRLENAIAASQGRAADVLAQRSHMQVAPTLPVVGSDRGPVIPTRSASGASTAAGGPVDLPGGPLQEFHPLPDDTGQAAGALGVFGWMSSPQGMIVTGLAALGVGVGAMWLWKKRR